MQSQTFGIPADLPEPMITEDSVRGKNVLITGGTTGIGRAIALNLAAQGCRILIFGRNAQHLNDALESLKGSPDLVSGFTADQSKPEDIDLIFKHVDDKLGGIDILINNAGVDGESIVEEKNWRYILETNLVGYMACTKMAVERMKKKGSGHIVFIGSMSAIERGEDSDVYVATKAGIQGFSDSLAKKLNKENIRVTLIEPGLVGSNMVTTPPAEQPEKIEKCEMLKAEDIAECVSYCLNQPPRCNIDTVRIRPLLQD